MKKLIIDAASEKILLCIITKKQSYTTTHLNSRENFDKFNILLSSFLLGNNTNSFRELFLEARNNIDDNIIIQPLPDYGLEKWWPKLTLFELNE